MTNSSWRKYGDQPKQPQSRQPDSSVASNPTTNPTADNPQSQPRLFALPQFKVIPGIIDYSTKVGATIWNNNTKSLDENYYLDTKTLSGFLSLVKERVEFEIASWGMAINVICATIDVLTSNSKTCCHPVLWNSSKCPYKSLSQYPLGDMPRWSRIAWLSTLWWFSM